MKEYFEIDEQKELARKKELKNKIFTTIFYVIFIVMIVAIYIVRRLDSIKTIIEDVRNKNFENIFVMIIGTVICIFLSFIIYKIFHRKKEKFNPVDFSKAITASVGIILILGFFYMIIKLTI